MARKASVERNTTETDISVDLNLDGSGKAEVSTGIPFFDHMLTLMARHGLVDLEVRARGDIEVDFHHTVEDTGIAIGEALKKALGNKSGIRRYGRADTPMMDSLA
ncbi:MAG: imidazoleglycerol-phosphate dehydratase, partial [Thermodesulfobacteriota bacterium]